MCEWLTHDAQRVLGQKLSKFIIKMKRFWLQISRKEAGGGRGGPL